MKVAMKVMYMKVAGAYCAILHQEPGKFFKLYPSYGTQASDHVFGTKRDPEMALRERRDG